ncbi:hypothetical protein Taro_015145 [Colocasia esculenta]|uniref:Cytochrome P450 n=1 Tax=Colocasia esculenta TaxID=4460 RepID=A0A843UK44_COLES|nr:hypothetical protein [Colocasia esculenta]
MPTHEAKPIYKEGTVGCTNLHINTSTVSTPPHFGSSSMELLVACQVFLALLAFVLLSISWLVPGRKKGKSKPLPPEPSGAWPVLGHLPVLMGKEIAARTLGRVADQYGPVFMLRLGAHRTLVISSHEAARECFTTFDREFAARPRIAAAKYIGYDYTMFGLASYGHLWREMRKISAMELLSTGRLEKLRHIRTAEVHTRMKELHELCATAAGRAQVEMKQWFEDTTFNVMVRMVVGRRYNFGGSGADGEQMRRFQKALVDLLYLAGSFVPSDAVPWLEWLDLQGYIKAMKQTSKELDAVADVWIEEHRQKRREKTDMAGDGDQDFIDVMLSAMDGVDLGGLDRDIAMKGTILSMVLGGTEPSSVTMTWALALLLNHRQVLDKIRQELDLHVGTARNVEEKDLANLVYLQAAMKEAMRLYPVAPLSVPHEATADCRVAGYHVPAGTRLYTNLWKLHRDPRVWADPEAFRPERFLAGGEAAGVDVRGKQFHYLPFSSGRRACPGITLALRVMQLTLARLVHGFELGTPGEAPVDMEEGPGMHITKAAPLEVVLSPRLPPHLYD